MSLKPFSSATQAEPGSTNSHNVHAHRAQACVLILSRPVPACSVRPHTGGTHWVATSGSLRNAVGCPDPGRLALSLHTSLLHHVDNARRCVVRDDCIHARFEADWIFVRFVCFRQVDLDRAKIESTRSQMTAFCTTRIARASPNGGQLTYVYEHSGHEKPCFIVWVLTNSVNLALLLCTVRLC
jgi:hypothetical protein